MTRLGLRVDVDTFRGTRDGVPRLLDLLAAHGVKASFFFSVGPDNMGRHLRRLLRPRFFAKMLRSNAASLYGWDILLAGTFWPGRRIGAALKQVLRGADEAGHEIGLHAWDHHRWQRHATDMSVEELEREIARGVDAFADAVGRKPDCSAAAGWICNERVVEAKERFAFRFNSDCRGRGPFRPVFKGKTYTVQVPTTLPTYDEAIGRGGVTQETYNDWLLARLRPQSDEVLAVHAEVEGIVCAATFDRFLAACRERAIELLPLGRLLEGRSPGEDGIAQGPIAGRDGEVCWQASTLTH
jgi:undecaprenyl phosphate-alpha-L-ara4FN deformylase